MFHSYGKTLSTLLFVALCGCGASQPSLQGTVTANGKPVEEGEITFNPLDTKNPTYGAQITGGKYQAKLNAGKYTVNVTGGGKAAAFPKSQADLKALPAKGIEMPDQIPPDAKGNGQTVEIKPGAQELNISLQYPDSRK